MCKHCVVHAAEESKIVVLSLNGYIVTEKNGQLVVCSLREEQSIKEFEKIHYSNNWKLNKTSCSRFHVIITRTKRCMQVN